MKKAYRFRSPKGRNIEVMFAHTPGKWVSTGTKDMVDAVLITEAQLKGEGLRTSHIPSLKQFADGFFTQADPQGWRRRLEAKNKKRLPSFYEHHQSRLDRYILPKFGARLINTITDIMIDDWLIALKQPNGSKLSENTKNKVLATFRVIMEEARRKGMVEDNAAAKVEQFAESNKKREPFHPVELLEMFPDRYEKLLYIWGSLMWACYFLVMRDTGFRPAEVAGLKLSNVSFQLGGVYTTGSVDGATRSFKNSIKTSNKGQGYKVGILTAQTLAMVQNLAVESNLGHDSYLFTINGKLLRPEVSNKHLRASLDRAGIERRDRTQYSLRHSFDTDLAGKIENKVLLELMAHTSLRKEYDHRTPEMILEQLQPVRAILEDRTRR